MGIEIKYPWLLLLLLPWLAMIGVMIRFTPRLSGLRKGTAIAVRALTLLLLIAVAAQVTPFQAVKQRNVVFVADRSASMGGGGEAGEWIARAWSSKADIDYAAIVASASHSAVERSLTDAPLPSGDRVVFRTQPDEGYTDLAKGLQLASALLRERGGGRIVLLSDGEENAGEARRSARLLKYEGIAVDVVLLPGAGKPDASIDRLSVPSMLKQGESFSFEITVQSTFAGPAELRLFADDKPLTASQVQLERGENRFWLQSLALDPGFHRFRTELYAEGDEQPNNNEAYAFSRVSGPPTVLIVEGEEGASANLEAALSASYMLHRTIAPEALSMELAEYAAYDSIILNNVPATRIAERPMEWLGKAVGDFGVGLIMAGGSDSFGLGGYFKTPVERALPVYMELQGKKQMPSLGLVLVIDRSGSMSDGKLELAKEAAMRTVELLRDEDNVGVVAFDSAPWWVVEPTDLGDREQVLERIRGIQAEGGTDIYPALSEGYEALLKMDVQRKHMILLTDGQSAGGSYDRLTDGMNDNRMTLSTVAVGADADRQLLKRLAEQAGGRYYFTQDQSTLPAIFSRETVLMSRTYIVDGEFVPAAGSAGSWNSLWAGGLPAVNAYVASTAKELAEVALWTPDGDPLLARWTYGSGRTAAWTSDLSGRWAPAWTSWPSFPAVFAEWVKWTFPQFDSSLYRVTANTTGTGAKLTVHAEADDPAHSQGKLAAAVQGEDGRSEIVTLMPIAPGHYEGKLERAEPGAYLAQIGPLIETEEGPAVQGRATAGVVIPYSPEYRIGSGDGGELMKALASVTEGRVLDPGDPAGAFRFAPMERRVLQDWTRPLLAAALLLWLLDIAVRRLSLPWRAISAKLLAPVIRLTHRAAVSREASPAAAAHSERLHRLHRRAEQKRRLHDSGSAGGESRGIQENERVRSSARRESPDDGRLPRETATAETSADGHGRAVDLKPDTDAAARHGSPGASADGHAPSTERSRKPSDADSSGGGKREAVDSINRLLAAKNKKKR